MARKKINKLDLTPDLKTYRVLILKTGQGAVPYEGRYLPARRFDQDTVFEEKVLEVNDGDPLLQTIVDLSQKSIEMHEENKRLRGVIEQYQDASKAIMKKVGG